MPFPKMSEAQKEALRMRRRQAYQDAKAQKKKRDKEEKDRIEDEKAKERQEKQRLRDIELLAMIKKASDLEEPDAN